MHCSLPQTDGEAETEGGHREGAAVHSVSAPWAAEQGSPVSSCSRSLCCSGSRVCGGVGRWGVLGRGWHCRGSAAGSANPTCEPRTPQARAPWPRLPFGLVPVYHVPSCPHIIEEVSGSHLVSTSSRLRAGPLHASLFSPAQQPSKGGGLVSIVQMRKLRFRDKEPV